MLLCTSKTTVKTNALKMGNMEHLSMHGLLFSRGALKPVMDNKSRENVGQFMTIQCYSQHFLGSSKVTVYSLKYNELRSSQKIKI